MNRFYSFLIPRLNGEGIIKNFPYYRSLVKKGVAGFILFGGKLGTVRKHIRMLQDEAALPLIIASDLEQGLGQQVQGGTLFPPAMAVAAAIIKGSGKSKIKSNESNVKSETLKVKRYQSREAERIFTAMAEEAAYAGINTVFAPVLDINTNPKNPIISVRSFGEDRETVSFFGREMTSALQEHGIAACAKHFPGHGDTSVDSHIRLPKIGKSLGSLRKTELYPFKKAIEARVEMIMLGHLNVPALDPAGVPATLSDKVVAFIRKKMRYHGILITDAMNMGGIGRYPEGKASAMALRAGVDLILHPSDPDSIAAYLDGKRLPCNSVLVNRFRWGLSPGCPADTPDFQAHADMAGKLSVEAIGIPEGLRLSRNICIVLLNDDQDRKGAIFVRRLKEKTEEVRTISLHRGTADRDLRIPDRSSLIVCVFSATKAWKGGAGGWVYRKIAELKDRADLFISFGSPYLLDVVGRQKRMPVYWDSPAAEDAAGKIIGSRLSGRVS